MPNVFAASAATLLLGSLPLAQSWAASPENVTPVAMNPIASPLHYESGRVNAEAQINPLTRRLLSRALKKEVPSEVEFSANNLAGQVTMPSGQAEFLEGAIALDAAPLRSILSPAFDRALVAAIKAYNLPQGLTPTQLETMFQYRFLGEGTLSLVDDSVNPSLLIDAAPKDTVLQESVPKESVPKESVPKESVPKESVPQRTSRFVFQYDDQTGAVRAEGLDPKIWAACRVQRCSTSMDGTFDIDLDIDGALKVSETLQVRLPGSVKRVLRNALFWGMERLDFASGTMTSDLITDPLEASLEPSNSDSPGGLQPTSSAPGAGVPTPQTAPRTVASPASPPHDSDRYSVDLTHGDFVITAQGSTVPWSAVFSMP